MLDAAASLCLWERRSIRLIIRNQGRYSEPILVCVKLKTTSSQVLFFSLRRLRSFSIRLFCEMDWLSTVCRSSRRSWKASLWRRTSFYDPKWTYDCIYLTNSDYFITYRLLIVTCFGRDVVWDEAATDFKLEDYETWKMLNIICYHLVTGQKWKGWSACVCVGCKY